MKTKKVKRKEMRMVQETLSPSYKTTEKYVLFHAV